MTVALFVSDACDNRHDFGANVFIVYVAARLLPGLMFTVFGPGQFMGIIAQSGFFVLVFGTQSVAGILLLIGRYVPIALALLAAGIANILVFHLTTEPSGLGPGLLALVLWMLAIIPARSHFTPLFEQKTRT